MAKLVILGGGIAGQTAALHARARLDSSHEVIVVTPNSHYNWIPSNIWVGIGETRKDQVIFPLAPVYRKTGITFYQARAIAVHPEGDESSGTPYVDIEYTAENCSGQSGKVCYDYLVNATGPKLNFAATKGLGPDNGFTCSVCTSDHAEETWMCLSEMIERMKRGERKSFLVGTGHGTCTCQGAAFEYALNLEFRLRREGVRDKATIAWISNEAEPGDFGFGGLHIKQGGYVTHSKIFTESIFAERGISWTTRSHVKEVRAGKIMAENLDGHEFEKSFDFAMLLPPFRGHDIRVFDRSNRDITSEVMAPNGFMLVDADYEKKPYEQWKPKDWPGTYRSIKYENIFAVGIAFAPPHAISRPAVNPNGIPIFPSPPRTGMPSAVTARIVAFNIADMMKGIADHPVRTASLARMGAACIASAGSSLLHGTAVSMTMYPIIPDFGTYPATGRDLHYTTGEIGLAGHWLKYILHYAFIYKAQGKPFWKLIPE
jgi:sulfide:quinone oxidoreductase